jgi:hypothetical protein
MKKEIALLLIIAAFVAGFFIGRRFPVHRFAYYEQSGVTFDTTTGEVCNPIANRETTLPLCKSN